MTTHHHKPREYPRVSEREQKQSDLLDGHESVNDRLRTRIAALEAEIAHWKELAAQQQQAGVAMRKWLPESCR